MSTLKKILATSLPYFALVGLLLACNYEYILTYLSLPLGGGWDGAGHASIAEYYSDHIFPSLWGWTPNWLAGMPFPQFYPPFFYFMLAVLHHLLPFSFLSLFKASIIIMSAAIPCLIAWIAERITRTKTSFWVAGLSSVILMSVYGVENNFGITLHSSLGSSLVTQLAASVFFFLWVGFFIEIEGSGRNKYIAGAFLTIVLLTSIHTVFFAALFYFIYAAIRIIAAYKEYPSRTKELFVLYFMAGFIPVLVSMAWYLPMLAHYRYFVTVPLEFMNGLTVSSLLLYHWAIIFLIFVWSAVIAWKKKNTTMLAISLSAFATFFLIAIDLGTYIPFLPLHAPRWLACVYFFSCISGAYAVKETYAKRKWVEQGAGIILLLTLLIFTGTKAPEKSDHAGFYISHENDYYKKVRDYLSRSEGMVSVEMAWVGTEPATFAYNAAAGAGSSRSLITVFREASISTVFLSPIRNALSVSSEAWGFRSYLVYDQDFLKQDFDRRLDLAEMTGIQKMLVRSKEEKDLLKESSRIELEKDFGKWELYTFKENILSATIPPYEPILSFVPVNFKERTYDSFDYARLQEQVMRRGELGYVFASPSSQEIDGKQGFGRFKTIFIGDYRYHDEGQAFKMLDEFSRDYPLILVESTDPLFKRLEKLGDTNKISIIPRGGTDKAYDKLFSTLWRTRIEVKAGNTIVESVNIHEKTIEVNIKKGTGADAPMPLIVKQSYFPAWKNTSGNPVYMATPGFMLTWAKEDFEMEFTTPPSVYAGYALSMIGLALSFLSIRKKKGYR